MTTLTKKKVIKFVDLQKYARENSYTVKKIKSRCFMWRKNGNKTFKVCNSIKETFESISEDIEYRKVWKTFRLLSEGF